MVSSPVPLRGRYTRRSMVMPTIMDTPQPIRITNQMGMPEKLISTSIVYTPTVSRSPWAKLISFSIPYTME